MWYNEDRDLEIGCNESRRQMDKYQILYQNLIKASERFGHPIGDLSDQATFKAFIDNQLERKRLNDVDPNEIMISLAKNSQSYTARDSYLVHRPVSRPQTAVSPKHTALPIEDIIADLINGLSEKEILAKYPYIANKDHKNTISFLWSTGPKSDVYASVDEFKSKARKWLSE